MYGVCTVWTCARYARASGGACVDASVVLIGFALVRSIWMFLVDSALRLTWMVLIGSGLRTPQWPLTQKPFGTKYESSS